MSNDVKVAKEQFQGTLSGYFWMLYFLLATGVVGSTFGYLVAIPLCLIGRVYPPSLRLGRRAMSRGVDTLVKAQPWLNVSSNLKSHDLHPIATYSNHRSHLDMYVLLARYPKLTVIAKNTLFNLPFLGVMLRVLRHIPLKKNDTASYRRAFETTLKAIQNGEHVHFFPEMTRCDAGFKGTQSFHLSPFQVLLKAGVPIYPIVFENSDEVWPKGSVSLRYGKKINVRQLGPIDPNAFQTADALRSHCKSVLDEALSPNLDPNLEMTATIISPKPACSLS